MNFQTIKHAIARRWSLLTGRRVPVGTVIAANDITVPVTDTSEKKVKNRLIRRYKVDTEAYWRDLDKVVDDDIYLIEGTTVRDQDDPSSVFYVLCGERSQKTLVVSQDVFKKYFKAV